MQRMLGACNKSAIRSAHCNKSACFATSSKAGWLLCKATNLFHTIIWAEHSAYSKLKSLSVVSGPFVPLCTLISEPTKEFEETRTAYNWCVNCSTADSLMTQQATVISGSKISAMVFPVLITASTRITFFVLGLINFSYLG